MRLGASFTGLTAMVRVESAGAPAGTAASFGRDIADGLQQTAWQSKEPPVSLPTDFIRFRREKRSPGTGSPKPVYPGRTTVLSAKQNSRPLDPLGYSLLRRSALLMH